MSHYAGADRRTLLKGAGGLLLGSLIAPGDTAALERDAEEVRPLPARNHTLIRNAYVMTMDAAGDLPNHDIRVEHGEIAAIGKDLPSEGAQVINGDGCIVLPGFVETHWHMWTTMVRGVNGTNAIDGYLAATTTVSTAYTAQDMYLSALLSAAEAINAGMTTVHDWCHNVQNLDFALADIKALQQSGLRARFSYGPTRTTPLTRPIDIASVEKLHSDWPAHSSGGLIHLGIAWRGVQGAFTENGRSETRMLDASVWKTEYDAAARMGLPLTMHLNDKGHVAALARLGLLNRDLQLIHCLVATPDEVAAIAAAGTNVCFAPFVEVKSVEGAIPIAEFSEKGIPIGLSIDSSPLAGSTDMFAAMRLTVNVPALRSRREYRLPSRRALELATIEGARTLGLGDQSGSLVKGKRADLIMVRTDDANMAPFIDPAFMLVNQAQPANVDTVMVDGRILKRAGKLTALNVHGLAIAVSDASRALRTRARLS